MRLIGFAVILAFGLTLAPLAAEAQPVRSVPAGAKVDILQSGRYLFEKRHTYALPLEQAEHAIHMLAAYRKGVNPVHLAVVPGAPKLSV
jgi:hypothetical protein